MKNVLLCLLFLLNTQGLWKNVLTDIAVAIANPDIS